MPNMISLKLFQYCLIFSIIFDIFPCLSYPCQESKPRNHWLSKEVGLDTGQWIAISLSALLGAWYFGGAIINRRRGVATYQWLKTGLEQTGKISEAKWIGSAGSGARLIVGKASAPYRRIEVVFLLESREIMPIWLFNRLRNKQDEMIFKANLKQVPIQEVESAPSGNRKLKDLLSTPGVDLNPFNEVSSPEGFGIIRRGGQDEERLVALREFLKKYRKSVFQFSLRRQSPHLILRARIPPLRENPAEDFIADLNALL